MTLNDAPAEPIALAVHESGRIFRRDVEIVVFRVEVPLSQSDRAIAAIRALSGG